MSWDSGPCLGEREALLAYCRHKAQECRDIARDYRAKDDAEAAESYTGQALAYADMALHLDGTVPL